MWVDDTSIINSWGHKFDSSDFISKEFYDYRSTFICLIIYNYIKSVSSIQAIHSNRIHYITIKGY